MTTCDKARVKVNDAVRHMDGREGYVLEVCDQGYTVVWVNGSRSPKPIKEGYLERIKNGLTSFAGPR